MKQRKSFGILGIGLGSLAVLLVVLQVLARSAFSLAERPLPEQRSQHGLNSIGIAQHANVFTYTETFETGQFHNLTDTTAVWSLPDGRVTLPELATAAKQQAPDIVINDAGHSYVVWEDDRNGQEDLDIFAQKFDSGGRPLWPTDVRINGDVGVAEQRAPVAVLDRDGNLLVFWSDRRQDESGIYGQKLNERGEKLWETADKLVSHNPVDATKSEPDAALDLQTGDVVVVWDDQGETSNIHAQRIKPNGGFAWERDKLVNLFTGKVQSEPTVGIDEVGNIYVAWADSRFDTRCPPICPAEHEDIYAQKLDSDGEPLWFEDVRVTEERVLRIVDFGNPVVQVDGMSGVYIVWEEFAAIRLQKLDPNGNKACLNNVIVNQVSGWTYSADLILTEAGTPFVVWGIHDVTSLGGLYGQKVDCENGAALWPEDRLLNRGVEASIQGASAMAVDDEENIRIVWGDSRFDDGDIMLQRVDIEGGWLLPRDVRLNGDKGVAIVGPQVVQGDGGNSYFAWGDGRDGYENVTPYVQGLNGEGNAVWPQDVRVNFEDTAVTHDDFIGPALTTFSNGDLAVAWNGDKRVYARRYFFDGDMTWPTEALVHQTVDDVTRHSPDIVTDSADESYVVWADARESGSTPQIYVQKLGRDGTPTWLEDRPVSTTTISRTRQSVPAVALDGFNNSLYVVWDDWRENIALQRIGLNGSPIWSEDLTVNSDSSVNDQARLSVASIAGDAYVAWEDDRDGGQHVYLQRVGADGTKLWSEDLQVGTGEKPFVAANAAGDLYVAYRVLEGNAYVILVQGILPDGSFKWATAKRVHRSGVKTVRDWSSLSVDAQGGLYATWEDYRLSQPGVYAQRLDANGEWVWAGDVRVTPTELYPRTATAVSLKVNQIAENITWATLQVEARLNEGEVVYQLSNDGGAHWFEVEPGVPHSFEGVAGADLRWRALLKSSSDRTQTPEIDWLQIAYSVGDLPPNAVYVLDANEQPVPQAEVYLNGELADVVDENGRLLFGVLEPGDSLAAMQLLHEQPTIRAGHELDGRSVAYRVYQTSLPIEGDGEVVGHEVAGAYEQHFLRLQPDQALILFNLVVSVEWDADDAYLEMLGRAFKRASDYLYDVTDGQMAFGQVSIYDQAENWADADFQISTKNTVRPYAFVGGITSEDTAHAIRVGRFWDGASGDGGNWDEAAGYRTLVHEFGHYALYLQDEYFLRTYDEQGHFAGVVAAACTGLEVIDNGLDATNASMMYYQYNASELADGDRWGINCQHTEQARVNGEPDWQTVVRYYGDDSVEPRWVLNTPTSRGSVMAGPEAFPQALLPFPKIGISNEGGNGTPRQLSVYDADGEPFPNALVALYTTPVSYTVAIDQGLTNLAGTLAVYGAVAGDVIQVASLDGGWAGSVLVDEAMAYAITLTATRPKLAKSMTNPYLTVVPGSEGDSLFLEVHGAMASSAALDAIVIPAAGGGGPQVTTLAYSGTREAYVGQVSFAGVGLGSGEVRVTGLAGNQLIRLNSNYNLTAVSNHKPNDLVSEDGNFQLHVDAGSLLNGADGYATVMPTGFVPSALPDRRRALGSAYEVRLSGAATTLEKPGLLTMSYHPEVVGNVSVERIYYWEPNGAVWQPVEREPDVVSGSVTGTIMQPGVYVLGGNYTVFLPIVVNHSQ